MKNLFIAFTPYHVLLSYGIALEQENAADNVLIAVSEGVDMEFILQVIQEQRIFVNIHKLPGALHKSHLFHRRAVSRKNVHAVKSLIQGFVADQIYVFNDARAETQVALYHTKKHNSFAKAIYVEDGAAAYSSETRKARGHVMKLLGKLYYGPWWEKVNYLGGSRWIDRVWVAFPELVRPELRSKMVTKLPRSTMLGAKMREIVELICAKFAVDNALLKSLDVILIVAHSEFAKQIGAYREMIENILAFLDRQRFRVAVKYHPREPAGDYLSLSDNDKVLILPQSIPIEMIYLQAPTNLKLVIGDISTSLYTARWLLETAHVISIAPLLKYDNPALLDTFRKLGVVLVNPKDSLGNAIIDQTVIKGRKNAQS